MVPMACWTAVGLTPRSFGFASASLKPALGDLEVLIR